MLDPTGAAWLVSMTNNGIPFLVSTVPPPSTSITAFFLQDRLISQQWRLSIAIEPISNNPEFLSNAVSGTTSQSYLYVNSPDGTLWGIQIANGLMQTIQLSLCIGFRDVNSLMCEIALHLLEPIVNTQVTQAITVPGSQTVPVNSTDAMYVGAQVVCDPSSANEEIITIDVVGAGVITANFLHTHPLNVGLLGATFPTQQPTDPFFTQAEILQYILNAQNEFLARVPSVFTLSQQQVSFGQILQQTPLRTIEINRVAYMQTSIPVTFLIRSGGNVTLKTASPHGLAATKKFSLYGAVPGTFNGAFQVATAPDDVTIIYPQVGPNATASPRGFIGAWVRMYERTQEQLTMQDPRWRSQFVTSLSSWFEDRAGNYKWGVAGKPVSNFPVELLYSTRGPDTLTMTDCLVVPDLFLHYVKYLVLSWAWSKDGEQRSPTMSNFCLQRFDAGVLASQRWIDGVLNKT